MAQKILNDIQKRYNNNFQFIKHHKRQALGPVRENILRLGRINCLLDFATLNKIRIQISDIQKVMKRITNDDLSAAATGAGMSPKQAIQTMQCEFARGYNQMIKRLEKQHIGTVLPEKKKQQCRFLNQHDKDRNRTSKELHGLIFE